MDVIGVSAAGMTEVVAICGTALTTQQVRALKRHSERIVVNFDPDAAGSNAAERSIQMLLEDSGCACWNSTAASIPTST